MSCFLENSSKLSELMLKKSKIIYQWGEINDYISDYFSDYNDYKIKSHIKTKNLYGCSHKVTHVAYP